MEKTCFGFMVSKGLSENCDVCGERVSCLDETNKRLKKETEKPLEVFSNEKHCRLVGVEGECE